MLDAEIDWQPKTKILGLRYHHLNDLIALACDDCCIRIVDKETRKLIRELRGCRGIILDWVSLSITVLYIGDEERLRDIISVSPTMGAGS